MKKRMMALSLLTAAALAVLAGCSSQTEETTTAAPATEAATEAKTEAEAETEAAEEETEAAAETEASGEDGPIIQKLKAGEPMIVGINAQSPPWRFHKVVDGKDELKGFEVSMCYGLGEYLSEQLGTTVNVEFNDMSLSGVLAALQAKKVDIAPGLAGTAERRENMDFSIPYHRSLQTIVIQKSREEDPMFAVENEMEGVKTASIQGSSTSVTFSEQYPKAELIGSE